MENSASIKRQLWANLLNDVAPALDLGERYCAAPGIHGSTYKPGGIAVIGRAPNAWAFDFAKEEIQDTDSGLVERVVNVHVCTAAKAMIDGRPEPECGRMHWIKHPYRYRGATRKNTEFGRFWPAIDKVMKSLLEPNGYERWEETIAWTNLYPVSYACGGNPNSRLEKAQRAASGELLCHDLQVWRPRAALFITEVNRKNGTRDLSCSRPFHDKLGISGIECRNGPAVAATSKMSAAGPDATAFFLVRPDARHLTEAAFAEWIGDVVNNVKLRRR